VDAALKSLAARCSDARIWTHHSFRLVGFPRNAIASDFVVISAPLPKIFVPRSETATIVA
jgi:hypothetical protein